MVMPDRLLDKKLYVSSPNCLYKVCIIFRLLLIVLIYLSKVSKNFIYILCVMTILMFSIKLIIRDRTWKNYLRTIISYSMMLIITMYEKNNKHISLIMLFDLLMGMQSKFIQSNLLN